MDAMINTATSSFETTTGFSMASVATWMWNNLAEPILGTGLGTLYTLRWYIVAAIALARILQNLDKTKTHPFGRVFEPYHRH
jgi:hypothetical protein